MWIGVNRHASNQPLVGKGKRVVSSAYIVSDYYVERKIDNYNQNACICALGHIRWGSQASSDASILSLVKGLFG